MQQTSLELPPGYYLEWDPDILVIRRLDGSMVGAFSARAAAPDAVRRTAEESGSRPAPEDREAPVRPRPLLRVRFFGHFEVLCDGEPLALGRNGKVLTILKYLLAQRSQPVSQDHLMGWLWPESNLKKARWSLNSAIHGLRKLLSGCLSSADSSSYVLLEEGYYRLCPTIRVTTDVDDFDVHYEQGLRLEKARRMPEAVAEYERAVGLYGGDYLIEDMYEDWTMVERERLSNAYMDMLSRLAVYYMNTGQYQESIQISYRVLEKDRCHEDSYRRLMQCYANLGLRGRALRQYGLCQKTLRQEYGTEPSPETRALYDDLLKDKSA